ncbi:MAG: insulinase family protein [Firmicutes bacterium]|nr:insulinase family protein [Bacillota bacterium]
MQRTEHPLRTGRGWVATAGILLIAATLAAQPQAAQQPGSKEVSASKVERKNRAPVSREVLRVKLPRPVEFTLPNGLTVLVLEDHRFPLVYAWMEIVGAGGLYEPAELRGVAQVTASMLAQGTAKRNAQQIAQAIEEQGASVNASAGFGEETATLIASGLSDNFEAWFALATELLLQPSFPQDELQKLLARQKASLRQARTQPAFLVNERFSQAVFGNHPAAVVSATEESLDKLTPEVLANWHRQRYVPQNSILGIAGDVRASQLRAKLQQWFAGWKRTDWKPELPPAPKPATEKKIYLVDRPNSQQTTLWLGNLTIHRRDPDYPALVVMNRILGGGAAARLFLNLREEKSYTYGAYSTLQALKFPGPWRAWADVRTEVTEGALTEFLHEIRRIREEKVPEGELTEAKNSMVANFALSLEQPQQLLSYAITRKLYGLPAEYWDSYPAQLQAVTADDVQRVAQKYLNPEALQIVAVGEGSKIRSVLEKYGPVVVYDTEGKPVEQKAARAAVPGR